MEQSTDTSEGGDVRIDPALPVLMFSGQGSQKPGMGADLMAIPAIAETFVCASDVYGFDVAKVALDGPEDVLNETRFAQAAILTLSIALTGYLREAHGGPSAVLGFSLGQISALPASGVLGIEETFFLAKARAEAMESAAKANPGAMCALLGADYDAVRTLCETCAEDGVLVIANHNCPGQIVISGDVGSIGRARDAWIEGGKKAVILATSGAFHSPLMQEAADGFSAYCETVVFSAPKTPFICNTDASLFREDEAAQRLCDHLVRPVLFQQSVEMLLGRGARIFVEVGYGAALTGFVKRIDRSTVRHTVDTVERLDAFLSS